MTTILSPRDLPPGLMRMYQVKDEAEAKAIGIGYLYQSKAIDALYLFVPVKIAA